MIDGMVEEEGVACPVDDMKKVEYCEGRENK